MPRARLARRARRVLARCRRARSRMPKRRRARRCTSRSRSPRPGSIRRLPVTRIRITSTARSSIRSIATTTSRGRFASCRIRPRQMPEITDDGKSWTIHLRKGIYFADDPVFKGKRRELTAADYVYALKRILDPKMRSNSLQMVDGRFVGADAVVARAKADRAIRLRRADRGFAGDRPLYAALPAGVRRLRAAVESDDDGDRRRRARSHRGARGCQRLGNGESGRNGSLPAAGLAPRPADRARGESDLPRRALPGRGGCRRSGTGERSCRPPASAGAARRHQHHRGGAAAPPRVSPEAARLRRRTGHDRHQRARRRQPR